MTVNILGTDYSIEFCKISENADLKEYDGICDPTSKRICVVNENRNNLDNFKELQNSILRHEIIHAFFNESGLQSNVENQEQGVPETYVDWFAIQSPKIFKVFKELKIL